MAPRTEADLLQLDPDGPLDHLLQGFESSYRYKDPDQTIIVGTRQARVSELMKEEREAKIAELRKAIRKAHANEAARREGAKAAAKVEADNRAGRPRAELVEALAAYEAWGNAYREAERMLTEARAAKTDLATSEAPIATLKKSLVDADAGIQAAEIRFEQIKTNGREPTQRLQGALGPAHGELAFRLGKERDSRTKANIVRLEELGFDRAALQREQIYGLEKLAACLKNVTRLERIKYQPYYGGGHPATQAREVLEAFERLDAELKPAQ